nr:MAG TPA: hypothetical protein [Caudoviricetes sp.]
MGTSISIPNKQHGYAWRAQTTMSPTVDGERISTEQRVRAA